MKKCNVTPFRRGYNTVAGPSIGDGELLMEFGFLALSGKTVYESAEPCERAFLLIRGDVTFSWEGHTERVRRGLWRDCGPYCLHVPAGIAVRIEGHADHSELSVHQTENENTFPARLLTPADAKDVRRGKDTLDGSTERIVRDIISQQSCPASNLVLGEVILKPGRWGGYPNHYHPQPEVFFFKYYPENGFGIANVGDRAYLTTNNTAVKITANCDHPCVCAPGYWQYSIWCIRNLPGDPYLKPTFNERFKALNAGW
ncbi:MAG: 5-deoxy-glucuronate isomerase [Eubacteriales bacterium]|nr:5-deoxy-glucuronate isomerase [Eubacteriales bacterium]